MKGMTVNFPADGINRLFSRAVPATTGATFKVPNRIEKPIVILVPLDFGIGAMESADFGIAVARRAHGRLLLVHAVHLNLNPYGPISLAQLKAELCQEAVERSKEILLRAQRAGVPVVCAVEEGEPSHVITRAAERWEADLIVMATRKHGRLGRLFRRGTAERVIEGVKCPVLTLQGEGKKEAYV